MRQDQESVNANNVLDVGHWVLRVELAASPNVFNRLREWKELEPNHSKHPSVTENLKIAMRNDMRSLS